MCSVGLAAVRGGGSMAGLGRGLREEGGGGKPVHGGLKRMAGEALHLGGEPSEGIWGRDNEA